LVRYSGGADKTYPDSGEWARDVVSKLADTKDWILTHNRPRRIRVSGSRRLSASVAIGAAFPAVSGFHVDIDYRGETWSTDSHPTNDTAPYSWRETQPSDEVHDLVIAMSVIREIETDVAEFARNQSIGGGTALSLHGEKPLVSAAQVNLAVRDAKNAIDAALAATKATKLHLFMAGPAPLALFLGHRLNATAPLVCYELTGDGSYQSTCVLDFR
jgi:hypothetical protein